MSMTLEALKMFVGDDQVLIYYLRVYENKKKQEEGAEGANLAEQQRYNTPTPAANVGNKGNPHHHHQHKQRGSSQHRTWNDKNASQQKQKN